MPQNPPTHPRRLRRWLGVSIPLLVIVIVLGIAAAAATAWLLRGRPGSKPARHLEAAPATLADSVQSLMRQGRLVEAEALAAEHLDALSGADETPEYLRVDAEWQWRTLQTLKTAADDQQKAWFAADSLEDSYRATRKKRLIVDADEQLDRIAQLRGQILGADHPWMASLKRERAIHFTTRSRHQEALKLLESALHTHRQLLGDRHPETALTLTTMSTVLSNLCEFERADDLARSGLAIRTAIFGEFHPEIAHSFNALGLIANAQQDYVQSEIYDRRRLSILLEAYGSESPQSIAAYHDLAVTLAGQNDFQGAYELYRDVLEILESNYGHDHFYTAFTSFNLSEALIGLGRYAEAEEILESSLPVIRKHSGDSETSIKTLLNLAEARLLLGKLEGIPDLLAEAERMIDAGGSETFESGRPYLLRGNLARRQGNLERAKQQYSSAAEIFLEHMGPQSHTYGIALQELAAIHSAQGQLDLAAETLKEACLAFELARRRVSANSLRRASFTARSSPYAALAWTQLQRGRADAAWQAAERGRARSLLDLLATSTVRPLSPEERTREKELDARIQQLESELGASKSGSGNTGTNVPARLDSLRVELQRARSAWQELQNEYGKRYPMAEGTAFDLQRVQAQIPEDAAIVGWLLHGETSYAYLVESRGQVQWYALPKPDDSSEEFLVSMRQASPRTDTWQALAGKILEQKLGPLADRLADLRLLHVIPSGDMLGVPFEALLQTADSAYAHLEIAYAPSATVLTWLRERALASHNATLLALADPPFREDHRQQMETQGLTLRESRTRDDGSDGPKRGHAAERIEAAYSRGDYSDLHRLVGARDEVEGIAAFFDEAQLLLGVEASETKLRSLAKTDALSRYGYLHFATHAIPDRRRGENCALILSQLGLPSVAQTIAQGEPVIDGRLTMEEVLRSWNLNANLVTLSACDTAIGREAAGEGMIGFAHGFFRAGTRSLLLSLWPVADRPTQLLMTRFYENLLVRESSKAEALRQAKAWLAAYENERGERPYRHPSFWAAFILVGVAY